MTFDTQLVAVKLEFNPYHKIELLRSLHTKNFIFFQFEDLLLICTRRSTGAASLQKNKKCITVDLDQQADILGISTLLYEENHSNPIDGYILVAYGLNDEFSKKITGYVKPVLVTGAYFTFHLDLSIESYVCQRYFDHCGETTFELSDPSKKGMTLKKKVFIVDEKFDSVLRFQDEKNLDSLSSNGRLIFYLSDYFFGDLKNIQVARRSDQFNQTYFVSAKPGDRGEHFAKISRPFKYTFDHFVKISSFITNGFTVNYESSLFKLNSDKTFVVAVSATANYFVGTLKRSKFFNLRTKGSLDYVSENKYFSSASSYFYMSQFNSLN